MMRLIAFVRPQYFRHASIYCETNVISEGSCAGIKRDAAMPSATAAPELHVPRSFRVTIARSVAVYRALGEANVMKVRL